jgi:hypothetical protein
MFNRWAIQHKVIVVSWRSRRATATFRESLLRRRINSASDSTRSFLATHTNLRPRRRIVNELCAYAGLTRLGMTRLRLQK